jgi:hypothetical protein
MRIEPGEDRRFPTTCARCGGRVSEPVAFCPHCGTHARLAFGDEVPRGEATSPKASADKPLADALWSSRPTPLFAATDFDRYADIRPPAGNRGRQWGVTGGTAVILVLFVALYGGAVLLHRHNDASTQVQERTLRTAQGSVQTGTTDVSQPGREGNSEAHRVPSSDGATAASPASSAETPSMPKMAAQAVPAAPPAPATTSAQAASPATASAVVPPPAPAMAAAAPPPAVTPPASSEQPVAPTQSVAAVAPAAPEQDDLSATQHERAQPRPEQSSRSREGVAAVVVPQARSEKTPPISTSRSGRQSLAARPPARAVSSTQEETRGERRQASVARSLALAQDSLAKNNLSAARRAITAAQAAEPQSSDVFMLQQDLLSREKARDSALGSARACIVQEQWNCAWHNAGSALSIDSSSVEAKALFNRAFVESGAAARPAGPGPDGPAVPMLTQ